MNIAIAGGTGFIGRSLVPALLADGHHVAVISRSADKVVKQFGRQVTALTWQQLQQRGANSLESIDTVINLAGASIGEKRWSKRRKQEILDSRIKPTSLLANYCAELKSHAPALLNANAVGVYGPQPTQEILPEAYSEQTAIDYQHPPDFLAFVGQQWELATDVAKKAGVRVVIMRFAVVLGHDGGILKQLKLPFKLGLGGKIGSGKQPFSWVSKSDLINAIKFLLQRREIQEPVNIVAPNCVTQAEFAKQFAHYLHRPCLFPMPSSIVKMLFGQMGKELLLQGQHVKPIVLMQNNYHFSHPTLQDYFNDSGKE